MEYFGKMAGAVGNYNAHLSAYPNVDWQSIAQNFVVSLGLDWNPYVTQVHPSSFSEDPKLSLTSRLPGVLNPTSALH